jgi:Fe-S-cluster containining protein
VQYENVIFPDSVGFRCKKCGVCCRTDPADISIKEQQKIEAKGFSNFLEKPNDSSNRNIRRKKNGSCFFANEKDACKIHDVKPAICVLEPFIITDYDYKTNRIFLGLNPLALTNCKGIFIGEITALEEMAKAAQNIVKEFLEMVANKTGLPVSDKKVGSITRKILLNA